MTWLLHIYLHNSAWWWHLGLLRSFWCLDFAFSISRLSLDPMWKSCRNCRCNETQRQINQMLSNVTLTACVQPMEMEQVRMSNRRCDRRHWRHAFQACYRGPLKSSYTHCSICCACWVAQSTWSKCDRPRVGIYSETGYWDDNPIRGSLAECSLTLGGLLGILLVDIRHAWNDVKDHWLSTIKQLNHSENPFEARQVPTSQLSQYRVSTSSTSGLSGTA